MINYTWIVIKLYNKQFRMKYETKMSNHNHMFELKYT